MNDWKLILDDMAKMAAGAMGLAEGVRKDAQEKMALRMERLARKMDFVPRQEFEVVQAMAQKARTEQEALKARVQKLETILGAKTAPRAKPAAKSKPKRAIKSKTKKRRAS